MVRRSGHPTSDALSRSLDQSRLRRKPGGDFLMERPTPGIRQAVESVTVVHAPSLTQGCVVIQNSRRISPETRRTAAARSAQRRKCGCECGPG